MNQIATPDDLRNTARFFNQLALGTLVRRQGNDRWSEGRASAWRQAARFLREDAAGLEGFAVKRFGGGPRAVVRAR